MSLTNSSSNFSYLILVVCSLFLSQFAITSYGNSTRVRRHFDRRILEDNLESLEAQYLFDLLHGSASQQYSLQNQREQSYQHIDLSPADIQSYFPTTRTASSEVNKRSESNRRSDVNKSSGVNKRSEVSERSELGNLNVGFLNKVTADGARSEKDKYMLKQFYGGSIGPG